MCTEIASSTTLPWRTFAAMLVLSGWFSSMTTLRCFWYCAAAHAPNGSDGDGGDGGANCREVPALNYEKSYDGESQTVMPIDYNDYA